MLQQKLLPKEREASAVGSEQHEPLESSIISTSHRIASALPTGSIRLWDQAASAIPTEPHLATQTEPRPPLESAHTAFLPSGISTCPIGIRHGNSLPTEQHQLVPHLRTQPPRTGSPNQAAPDAPPPPHTMVCTEFHPTASRRSSRLPNKIALAHVGGKEAPEE